MKTTAGFSMEQPMCLMKWLRTRGNNSPFIQPLCVAKPSVPGGAHFIIWSLKWTLENTIAGGNDLPTALAQQQTFLYRNVLYRRYARFIKIDYHIGVKLSFVLNLSPRFWVLFPSALSILERETSDCRVSKSVEHLGICQYLFF